MTKALLDTCALIYYLNGEDKLSFAKHYELHISPLSWWEMALLVQKGKLKTPAPVEYMIEKVARSFMELPLISLDIIHLMQLQVFEDHKDPFDKMLIAQAIRHKIPVITSDRKFQRYPIEVIEVEDDLVKAKRSHRLPAT